MKKIVSLGLLLLVCFLIYQNWDIVFSESQNLYYGIKYNSFASNKSASNVEDRIIFSKLLRKNMSMKIYLPPHYSAEKQIRYPVLYLLHGYPGTDRDWLMNTNLQKRLDQKIMAKAIPPLIVVFPDMNGPLIRDSQYLDATKIDQKMESYFIKELVPYIDQHYQTINNRRARAIGGLSSGGFGAMYVGLRNNNLFSYIFSHSGYMINNESIMNQLIVNFNKNRNKYSPLKFVDRIKFNQPLFIYFDIGKDDDHNFIQSNYLFDQKLSQLKIDHVFKLTEGRHGWKVWGKNIDNSLSYLTKLQTAKFQ